MSAFSESNGVPIPTASVNKGGIIFNALIGEGGFGRVLSGMVIKTRTWYAVKEINKYNVTQHQTGLAMLFSELNALKIVTEEPSNHFIVGLQAAFHDKLSCYLILDLKTGGDLRYYLRKRLIFKEANVAFFISCIGSALEFIHSKNVLHRDVKPENIILDSRGYPHLTDFGVAYVQPEGMEGVLTCNLASGTKQYLAPEVYCKNNAHGVASDYWSLGVLAFELLFGQRPFERHCPAQHISYLEECLKRTALKKIFAESVKDGAWLGSPSRDAVSTPSSGPSTPSGCGSLDMTAASTQRTAALETKDALFSSKKRNFRKFPNLSTGAGSGDGTQGSGVPGEGEMVGGSVFGFGSEVLSETGCNGSSLLNMAGIVKNGNTEKTENQLSSYNTCFSHTPESKHSTSSRQGNNHTIGNGTDEKGCQEEKKIQKEKRPMIQLKVPLSKEEEVSRSNGTAGQMLSSNTPSFSQSQSMSQSQSQSQSQKSVNGIYNSQQKTFQRNGNTFSDSGSMDDSVEGGFITVDHWTVHATVLPVQLQVLIPRESDWLGKISDSCIEGFFDVRPSHRIGGRNLRALKEHSWFFEKEVPPWDSLHSREYEPHFQPDQKYMENTFWRGEALEKFEETIREENVMQTPQIDVAFERSFDGFVHTSENFLDLLQRKGRSEKGMNNTSDCDDNSRTDNCENENNSRKNNFILSDEEINIKNSKLNIRISDSKSGCCYTNNSGPLYRKGTYSPKAEHLMSTSSSSSSSFSSSNAGEGGYQSKQDGGVILNPI